MIKYRKNFKLNAQHCGTINLLYFDARHRRFKGLVDLRHVWVRSIWSDSNDIIWAGITYNGGERFRCHYKTLLGAADAELRAKLALMFEAFSRQEVRERITRGR